MESETRQTGMKEGEGRRKKKVCKVNEKGSDGRGSDSMTEWERKTSQIIGKRQYHIVRAWEKKNVREGKQNGWGKDKRATVKLGDRKGETGSSECLMESGGVYWSARQRRLFHLVIQLFSHLVDVVSSCEGLVRTLRPPMQNRRVALKNMKVMAL